MKLYGFYRSSAAYRVRIALDLKGLAYEQQLINLRAGDQFGGGYAAVNPQARVPSLVLDDGTVLIQSGAIIEFLDETHPEPPLLPGDPAGRARVRALTDIVACDIHPLGNLAPLRYLRRELGQDEAAVNRWAAHWIEVGFDALEALLAESAATGTFCHGDRPGLADIHLVPQLANARRFGCDLARYPTILRIEAACAALAPFERARPENQPEAAELG